MVLSVYEQRGTKMIARVCRHEVGITNPMFNRHYIDLIKPYGTSRNNHGMDCVKDINEIYEWLEKYDYVKKA